MPIFDSVRDAIRGAGQRIANDPLEAADLFIPGNARQNGRWSPSGIASGVGQVLTGVPAALSQGFISDLFRGGARDPMTHAGLGPTNATPTTGGAGFLQGGFGGGSGRDPNWRSQGVSDWAQGASGAARAATDARNTEIANEARGTNSDINEFREGGGSSQGRSTARVTGGDVSLIEHVRAQFNRGGTQAER
jgi:hypothetical protein